MPPYLRVLTGAVAVACAVGVAVPGPASGAGLNLHRGSHGPQVRILEGRLHELHLLPASAVDKRFRPGTTRAVKRFQRQVHLRVTGKVNQRTWSLVANEVKRRRTPPRAPAPAAPPAPLVIGHRGAGGPVPENTLAAMRYASRSADVLEFDIRLTSDRKFVLMHDETLDRTTNCAGPVSGKTLTELRENCVVDDAGASEPIPSFDEVAAYAQRVAKRISPELKDESLTDDDLAAAVGVLEAHGLSSRTYLQSFYPGYFPRLRALDASLTFVYLSSSATPPATVRAAGAAIAGPNRVNLTAAKVAAYKKAGLRVWAWTASTTAELKSLWDRRVDGVFTDIPAQARQLFHPRG